VVEVIIAGSILGITLAFMVGPVFVLLIETSLTKGIYKAIILDLGVLLADVLFIALVFLGSAFLLNDQNIRWIYNLGGMLIIAYGMYNIMSARKKQAHLAIHPQLPPTSVSNLLFFFKGFFINFLNVGVFAYWLATTVTLRATFKDSPDETDLLWAYFISTIATYFITDLVKIFAAQRIKKMLTPRALIRVERIVGVILIFFGLFLIVRGYLYARGIGIEANTLG
jgi:threonine/homoserine/homoserine lactone efflux protein